MRLEGNIRLPHIHGVFPERRAAVRADIRAGVFLPFQIADNFIQYFPDLAENIRVQLGRDHKADAHHTVVGEF